MLVAVLVGAGEHTVDETAADEVDDVIQLRMPEDQLRLEPVIECRLPNTGLDRPAALGLEVGVAVLAVEQLVDRWRTEAGTVIREQGRHARKGIGDADLARGLVAERLVVLVTQTAVQYQVAVQQRQHVAQVEGIILGAAVQVAVLTPTAPVLTEPLVTEQRGVGALAEGRFQDQVVVELVVLVAVVVGDPVTLVVDGYRLTLVVEGGVIQCEGIPRRRSVI